MQYNIGEFCNLLGISPDTLRYYERCHLIETSKNPQNRYRSFTKQNALDIWNLQMLRSLDMGLRDMKALRKGEGGLTQAQWLRARECAISEEIARLQIKRERLRQLALLHEAEKHINCVWLREDMSASHALYVLGEGRALDTQLLPEMPKWVAAFPFTYVAVGITQESLTSEESSLAIRLGLGVLEKNREIVGLSIPPKAESVPSHRCASFVVRKRDVFALTKTDLAPCYAYLTQNQLRIVAPAAGRILCAVHGEMEPEYIICLSIPVEKITNIS